MTCDNVQCALAKSCSAPQALGWAAEHAHALCAAVLAYVRLLMNSARYPASSGVPKSD